MRSTTASLSFIDPSSARSRAFRSGMADLPPSAPPMGAAYQMFDFSDKSADFSTGSPACSINGVGRAIPSAQAVDLFRQPGVAAGVVGFDVRQEIGRAHV